MCFTLMDVIAKKVIKTTIHIVILICRSSQILRLFKIWQALAKEASSTTKDRLPSIVRKLLKLLGRLVKRIKHAAHASLHPANHTYGIHPKGPLARGTSCYVVNV